MDTYSCKLEKDALQHCKDVLNECEEKKIKYLKELRDWLEENKHLNAYTDTFNLLRFLRVSKYNLEGTKERLSAFYSFKTSTPEWFLNRDPFLPEMKVFIPLLKRDRQGRLVVIIRTAAHDPQVQCQEDVFKVGLMILDVALMEEDTSVFGVSAVFDMEGISQAHASALSISMIRKAVTSWQVYPVRVRSLDFINSPSYINVVLNIFKTFMSTRMKERVNVHGSSIDSLQEIVPKDILPEEYGGTEGKLQDLIDHWHRKVNDSRDWFLNDEKHKAES